MEINKGFLFIFISIFIYSSFAEDISITGTVKTSGGEAIAGASLCLKSDQNLTTLTDSLGKFHLTSITGISSHFSINSQSMNPVIKGEYISFSTYSIKESVKLEIYNSRGVMVSKRIIENLSPGRHTVPLIETRVAQGLYLVRLKASEITDIVKMIATENKSVSGNIPDWNKKTSLQIRERLPFGVDSLFITASGFARKLVDVDSYTQKDIEIILSPAEYNNGMVKIMAKGFSFQRGSESGDNNEKPVHTVVLTHDLWMDTTEITQAEYDAMLSSTYEDYFSPDWEEEIGIGDNYPAYIVNQHDVILYCNARSKKEGLDTVYTFSYIVDIPGFDCELEGLDVDYSKFGYRLPTEAEWEYACRGGTTGDYFWSDISGVSADDYAWYSENSNNKLHEVAQKLPNQYGLYDIAGNVWEWCKDWYGTYQSQTQIDPTGPMNAEFVIGRGGGWSDPIATLRSANRGKSYELSSVDADFDWSNRGFRPVLPVE